MSGRPAECDGRKVTIEVAVRQRERRRGAVARERQQQKARRMVQLRAGVVGDETDRWAIAGIVAVYLCRTTRLFFIYVEASVGMRLIRDLFV